MAFLTGSSWRWSDAQAMRQEENFLKGVALFNREDWFEAHEVWEDDWGQAATSDKAFYQGLIKIAIALCHYYNGNGRGARRLYREGSDCLYKYLPSFKGIDLETFLHDVTECFNPILDDQTIDWVAGKPKAPRLIIDAGGLPGSRS